MRNQNFGLLLALIGIGAYLVLFFATRLPSLEGVTGAPFPRLAFFLYLLTPEILVAGWFGEPASLAIADRLPVLALAAGILAYAFSLGWLLMALIGADRRLTRLEVFVFSTAVGLGVVSSYVLLVGLAGALGNVLVLAVPAALTLAAAGRLRWRRASEDLGENIEAAHGGGRKPAARAAKPPAADDSDWLSPRWLWLAAPFVVVIVLAGMLPPLDFDVREYHLQVPKEFFQQGRIGFVAHNVYGNMAMGTEMLSLLGMIVADDWWLGALVGKTVIAAFAPLAALGLLAAGRRFLSPAAGVVAAVAYLATPWIARVSTSGLVEGASACYLLLAVYAVLLYGTSDDLRAGKKSDDSTPGEKAKNKAGSRGRGKQTPKGDGDERPPMAADSGLPWLMLAGYLAGAAVSTKYPAALFVLLPLAVWVLVIRGWEGRRGALRRAAVFGLAAALGCGLWFGKNAVLTGNPTYPLLYEVFDTADWSPEKNAHWNQAHRPHDFSPQTLVADAARVAVRSEWLSPILMPLAVVGLLSGLMLPGTKTEERRLARALGIYILFVLAAWWLLTHRIDRFWIPLLPLAALLAGQGACWSTRRPWRFAVVGMLVLASLFGFLAVSSGAGGYNRYFVPLDRLRVAPERIDPWHGYVNALAGCGRLLLVGDAEPFDLEVPVAYDTVFDDSVFEQLVAGRSGAEARRALADRGITHVLVDWGEIARYRGPGNYGFAQFVQPEVFDHLVSEGVLRPLPPPPGLEDDPGRIYEVAGGDTR